MKPVANRAALGNRLDGVRRSSQIAGHPAGLLGLAEWSDLLLPCQPCASLHHLDWARLTFEFASYLDDVRSLVVRIMCRT